MLLSLLYPNLKYSQKGFHQDHLHPYSAFENRDDLKALNLPEGRGIMDLDIIDDWRHKRNTLANFDEFIEMRKKLMVDEIKKILL